MKRRLLWNFELNTEQHLDFPSQNEPVMKDIRWECRYFWKEDDIITLSGLDECCFELSRYPIKHKEDTYYLLPHDAHNLKIRDHVLSYKPLLMQKNHVLGFGKKVTLNTHSTTIRLPDGQEEDLQALMTRVHQKGYPVTVLKETLTIPLDTTPSTKIELAWLHVNHKGYFSVCIQSKARAFVESVSKQMLGQVEPTDYVSFLKKECRSHG